jgi:creatinine amidohydrolase
MVFDWQNTTFEVEAARPPLAVLPVGATEPGGPHLPLSAATIILDALARQVAEHLPWDSYLLPTLPLGTSEAHLGQPGTVALEWPTLMHVLYDLVDSLVTQGIHKVVILNGLGGLTATRVRPTENYIVKATVRQLNYDLPALDCIWLQPFTVAGRALATIIESADVDVHAGELATSLLLHVAPNTVHGLGKDFVPAESRDYLDWVPFAQVCPPGVWGQPGLASAEKGARALELAVHASAAYIEATLIQMERLKRPLSPSEERPS